jgi:hypothetical protein
MVLSVDQPATLSCCRARKQEGSSWKLMTFFVALGSPSFLRSSMAFFSLVVPCIDASFLPLKYLRALNLPFLARTFCPSKK